MAAVGSAAGVSRQTVYVQFGTRAGLLVQMVRDRDEANPRASASTQRSPCPTRSMPSWNSPASSPDGGARSTRSPGRCAPPRSPTRPREPLGRTAWGTCVFTAKVVQRLDEAGVLSAGWEVPHASEWLASQLNPLNWLFLVEDSGWTQDLYEERMATIVRAVLVEA
jgi:AcrR family transcriptional regulator